MLNVLDVVTIVSYYLALVLQTAIYLVVFFWNYTVMKSNVPLLDRYLGTMLGLAAGDALRTTIEFRAPGTFEQLTEIVGGSLLF